MTKITSTLAARIRMTAAERRQSIVDTAIRLFAERGFRGTTTRQLAAAVGVSEPVLYQHFRTKGELYTAILESQSEHQMTCVAAQLQPLIEAEDDTAFFEAIGYGILGWYLDDSRFIRLLLHSALEGHELSDLFYEKQVAPFYEVLESYLSKRMKQGAFRKEEPGVVARAFTGMFAHAGMIGSVYRPGLIGPDRKAIVEPLVRVFLQGLAVPAKSSNSTKKRK
jgi:AcrR family transcriptional regulator